jgi:hypothetical protein
MSQIGVRSTGNPRHALKKCACGSAVLAFFSVGFGVPLI